MKSVYHAQIKKGSLWTSSTPYPFGISIISWWIFIRLHTQCQQPFRNMVLLQIRPISFLDGKQKWRATNFRSGFPLCSNFVLVLLDHAQVYIPVETCLTSRNNRYKRIAVCLSYMIKYYKYKHILPAQYLWLILQCKKKKIQFEVKYTVLDPFILSREWSWSFNKSQALKVTKILPWSAIRCT